jgi:hypothetical protein
MHRGELLVARDVGHLLVRAVAQFERGQPGRSRSGSTIQYAGIPKLSYTSFFRFRSYIRVLGDETSTARAGGSSWYIVPKESDGTTATSGMRCWNRLTLMPTPGRTTRFSGHAWTRIIINLVTTS